jgi:ketosteroid isomerase-like protein
MNILKLRFPLIALLAFAAIFNSNAQIMELDEVKTQIIEMNDKEMGAFKSGDCKTFIDLIADDATFYLDGRKAPKKEMIFGFCNRVPRPFEKASNVTIDFFPTSKNSAYVIRIMEFSKDEKVYKKEIVTKIWLKGDDGWKISHLHSTIKEL